MFGPIELLIIGVTVVPLLLIGAAAVKYLRRKG